MGNNTSCCGSDNEKIDCDGKESKEKESKKNASPSGAACCSGSEKKNVSCCGQVAEAPVCGAANNGDNDGNQDRPLPKADWILDYQSTPVGRIPIIKTALSAADRRGSWMARWSKKRMAYSVSPGMYGIGEPDADSPVLVTANYKLTLDALRKELGGLNAWILVLDTRGINVWCAAGKRTFGTDELINRIKAVNLDSLVSHRKVILPQLGAPGVSAHVVTKGTGFKVIYGPVRAADIPAFLENGYTKTRAMRKVFFTVKDRLAVSPMEIRMSAKYILFIGILFLLLNLLKGGAVLDDTLKEILLAAGSILIGALFTPLLLPWIPGRSFAWKGWLLGGLFVGLTSYFLSGGLWYPVVMYLLIFPPVASYLALNFTGSSTFTSLSGVVQEMKISLPLMIISVIGGLALKIYSLF